MSTTILLKFMYHFYQINTIINIWVYRGDIVRRFKELYLALGIGFFFLFCILTIMLTFDTGVIAPSGGQVGLCHINNLIKYKENATLDKISSVLLYLSFIVVLYAVILGIYQLVKEKSLKKVDVEIIIFGILLVLAVIIWILFDKLLIINVRPLDASEGSFPSTHVFMTTFLMLSGHMFLTKKFDNKAIKYSTLIVAIIFIVLVTAFRVLAGKHYITDVCGGLLIGLSFYFTTFGAAKKFNYLKKDKKHD